MNKKVKCILAGGILSANIVASSIAVFADNTLGTINNINVERTALKGTDWQKTTTEEELNKNWNYFIDKNDNVVLTSYKGDSKKVEIPRVVDGKTVMLRGLSKNMFPGVTHIKVAEPKNQECKVKINAISLKFAFENSDIEYVDFSGLDTTGLKSVYGMFQKCSKLKYVDLSGWDASKVTDVQYMFYQSFNIVIINFSKWNLSDNLYIKELSFIERSSKLKQVILDDASDKTISIFKSYLGDLDKYNWQIILTIDQLNKYWDYRMYEGKILLVKYKGNHKRVEIPRTVEGKTVMLYGLDSLMFPNVTHIRVAQAENGEEKVKINTETLKLHFVDSKIEYVDFSGLDTTGLTDLYGMFARCSNLKYANLDGWDVSKVTDLQYMFFDAANLETIDLSRWKLPKAAEVKSLCAISRTPKLKTIILKGANDVTHKIFDIKKK